MAWQELGISELKEDILYNLHRMDVRIETLEQQEPMLIMFRISRSAVVDTTFDIRAEIVESVTEAINAGAYTVSPDNILWFSAVSDVVGDDTYVIFFNFMANRDRHRLARQVTVQEILYLESRLQHLRSVLSINMPEEDVDDISAFINKITPELDNMILEKDRIS